MTIKPPSGIQHRYADVKNSAPLTFSKADRTVDAVISMGSPVRRFYGTEVLTIDRSAVIVDRLVAGGIPLLDSHQSGSITNALGRVTRIWFEDGALMGTLLFNETSQGEMAMGMVARGEIAGISAGYRVDEWEVADSDGNIIDEGQMRWSDGDDLIFTATKWELFECSLVSVPADSLSGVRSLSVDNGNSIDNIRERMTIRERMQIRQAMHDKQSAIEH